MSCKVEYCSFRPGTPSLSIFNQNKGCRVLTEQNYEGLEHLMIIWYCYECAVAVEEDKQGRCAGCNNTLNETGYIERRSIDSKEDLEQTLRDLETRLERALEG